MCTNEEQRNLVIISKWGSDCLQRSQFKQTFLGVSDSDSSNFKSSFVPLKLMVVIDRKQDKVIWLNTLPSSVRFCRPITICFINETQDVIKKETTYIEDQAINLNKTEIPTTTGQIEIKYKFMLNMVDSKV